MAVHFRRNARCLLLVEPVRGTGVLRVAGGHVQFDKGGELLSLAVDHVFQIDRLSLTEQFLVLMGELHVADLLRDVDFACLRIVAGIVRTSRHLVQRDE